MSVDAQILSALRSVAGGSVSGAELAQRLGISRAAVWARIQELRDLGYDIAASPHLGYRLVSVPDVLHADDLMARLGPAQHLGRDVRVFQQTTSTNDLLERLARDGVAEGVVVFAESQTKGRGRLGRRWFSAAGKGLWFSALLRPPLRPAQATQLTVAAAAALARVIRAHTGLPAGVKWPNDILVRGRKLAGILTELSAELDRIKHLVLGIGVNVNQLASDFPPEVRAAATSLRIETGRALDRAELAVELLRELEAQCQRVCAGQFEAVAEEWSAVCLTLGHPVQVAVGERRLRGRAEALDADGALLVRTQHGRLERVTGGDVTME